MAQKCSRYVDLLFLQNRLQMWCVVKAKPWRFYPRESDALSIVPRCDP
jgi:hypothetical protein